MFSLHLAILAIALLPSTTLALTATAPTTIAAGTDVQIAITNDIGNKTWSYDSDTTTFQTYLMGYPANATIIDKLSPTCLLINSTANTVSDITVRIPAFVGPSGFFYSISTPEYTHGATWLFGSETFNLTGATGAWPNYVLEGYPFYNYGNAPCESLPCVNACMDEYDNDNEESVAPLVACLQMCDNVPIADYLLEETNSTAISSAAASIAATRVAATSTSTGATATSTLMHTATSAAASESSVSNSASGQASSSLSWVVVVGFAALLGSS